MKVGMTLQLTSFGGKPDRETYQDELNLMEICPRTWASIRSGRSIIISPAT